MSGRGSSSAVLLTLAVTAVAIALYTNTLDHGFVWDDASAVVQNRGVRPEKAPLATILTDDYWGMGMDDPESHKSYRPFTVLTFRLNYMASGMQPWSWHLVNVLCHALATLLLQLALLEALHDVELASTTSLFFAVHPVHVESVANLANGRAETLCAVGVFGCLLCYLLGARHAPQPTVPEAAQPQWRWAGHGWRIAAALFYLISSLSKEIGLTVVGITMVYDALLLSRAVDGPALARKLLGVLKFVGLGPLARLLTVGSVLNSDASARGGLKRGPAAPQKKGAAPPSAWAVWRSRHLYLWLVVAGVLYVRKAISGSGALGVPGFAVAERVLYTPLAGFCLLLALALRIMLRRWYARLPVVLAIAGAYAMRAWKRNPDWASNVALWTSEGKVSPNCCHSILSQGNALLGHDYNMKTDSYSYDEKLITEKNVRRALDYQLEGITHCPEDLDAFENTLLFAQWLATKFDQKADAKEYIQRFKDLAEQGFRTRRQDLAWSFWCETHGPWECGPAFPKTDYLEKLLGRI